MLPDSPFANLSTDPLAPPLPIDLPTEGRGSLAWWRKELEGAAEKVKNLKDTDWDKNILSYRAKTLTIRPDADTVVVPRDFPFVEQKIAQLFFQLPEVHLTARQTGLEDAVQIFQPVINYYLSEDEVNALSVMNECAFDALCPSGLMVSVIGFETFSEGQTTIATGAMQPAEGEEPSEEPGLGQSAPDLLPGQVLGTGAPLPEPPMVPVEEPVPNIVFQRYFWERLSPAQVRLPDGWSSSVYDKAPWIAYAFEEDEVVLKKQYKVPDSVKLKTSTKDDEDLKLRSERRDQSRSKVGKIKGCVIWYKASLFDPSISHPLRLRQLVICDGYDQPLVHRDSPYQKLSSGQLTGMIGFPIHMGALRYVSDTAFPDSECTISRASNEELNKGRTQMMQQRDRSIPMRYASLTKLGGEKGLEKIRKGIVQGLIPLTDFDPAKPPIGVVALSSFPRENFTFNDYLDRDLGQIWAMGANQLGQENEDQRTATEVAKIDQWATTRLDKERRMMLAYFIAGVRKLAALIQLFATDTEYIQILGGTDQQRLVAWNKDVIQGKYAFTIRPDSSIRIDQAQAQTRILKLYEQLGKDPNVRRTELLKEVCRQWNLDPAKVVVEQLPEKGPDPASLTMRLDPIALSVQNPNFPLYYAMLKEAGYKSLDQPDPAMGGMTPIQMAFELAKFQAAVMAQGAGAGMTPGQPPQFGAGGPTSPSTRDAEHPGSMPKMDHINKHVADETGELPGPGPSIQ